MAATYFAARGYHKARVYQATSLAIAIWEQPLDAQCGYQVRLHHWIAWLKESFERVEWEPSYALNASIHYMLWYRSFPRNPIQTLALGRFRLAAPDRPQV